MFENYRIPAVKIFEISYQTEIDYVPLKFVMNTILMRFPPAIRSLFLAENKSKIIKMTSHQALLFNYLNATELEFAMGFDTFTELNDLVPFEDVQKFYCAIGADLLSQLHAQYYNHELSMNQTTFIELSRQIRATTLEEARRLSNLWKK